ncbi:hypothetical protein AKJ65_05710 [candidate division MSBL1 archaeon SCGC-AAA259E19]|uniref:protein-L-isoaspartate(D-aspartate) O-methyltransferase n=1 Tax=candidate division MSBL1 archaeon SCGC-AAA259E19 TaxID=1698264 RepID=A0A133UIG2_9EURY|nr:hypothetical protein AKJ65_05710 [candidate division MSBL1 archaeon SCGC-AAA259E19]
MIDRYIREGYLEEGSKLANAMRKVPRELFMPDRYVEDSYSDDPFSIPPFSSRGQTISAPYTYPLFYGPLELGEGDKFLEIGTGSGYGAALAREMVGAEGKVVTVEINPTTYRFGREKLRKAGYDDILAMEGDGSKGLPKEAPFDKICLTAAAPDFPEPLKEQLATPGKMIGPIGSTSRSPSVFGSGQDLILLEMDARGEEGRKTVERVIYVPLRGAHGKV